MKMITQNRKGWGKGGTKTSLSLFFYEVMNSTSFSSSSGKKNIEKDTWEKIDIKVIDTLSTERKQMEDGWIINKYKRDEWYRNLIWWKSLEWGDTWHRKMTK